MYSYNCIYLIVINHDEISPTETVSPTSCVFSPTQQISTITETTTVLVSATTMTQSSSDSDAAAIYVPIVVVFGVIILVVVVIIGILIWRKMKSIDETPPYNKSVTKTNVLVENDLYGLVY